MKVNEGSPGQTGDQTRDREVTRTGSSHPGHVTRTKYLEVPTWMNLL